MPERLLTEDCFAKRLLTEDFRAKTSSPRRFLSRTSSPRRRKNVPLQLTSWRGIPRIINLSRPLQSHQKDARSFVRFLALTANPARATVSLQEKE